MGFKKWCTREYDNARRDLIAEALGLGNLAAGVLAVRGYSTTSAAALVDGADSLHDPFLLKDMQMAVERIQRAISGGEAIAVFGDYDCDGVTATAILYSYFEMLGAKVFFYIPSRESEGYGLSTRAIDELQKLGVTLIVTVDNGIGAHKEVDYAKQLGIDVVITDHHRVQGELPCAVAVVNPHRTDCEYPFKELAGVGVAFKLVCAMEGDLGYETLEHYSDLLALGTVADVMSLTGENRLFVRHGLRSITEGARPGIAALAVSCNLADKRITSTSVAFSMVPRINAAGRMGDADIAVLLCLTDRLGEAQEYCEQLDGYNNSRKEREREIYEQITSIIESDPDCLSRRVIALWGEGWSSGLLGIVCSRVVDKYAKPCVLMSVEGDEARGSGRSLPGFSLIEAVASCEPLLTRFGGHPLAAGFTLPACNTDKFAKELERYAAEHHPAMPVGSILIDCEVKPDDLSVQSVEQLERLEPFGQGNETPMLMLRGAKLLRRMPTADGRHVRLALSCGGFELVAAFFGASAARLPYLEGDILDIAFNTDINMWNNKRSVNIKIKDIRLSGADIDALIKDSGRYQCHLRGEQLSESELPGREEIAVVYRLIRAAGAFPADREYLAQRLAALGIGYTKGMLAADVLLELELIEEQETPAGRRLAVKPGAARADIANSATLRRHRQQPAMI